MKRVFAVIAVAILVSIVIFASMGGFDNKAAFAGDWYWDGKWVFTFYSDGTCKARGEYGTCTWDIVDGELKITNVYSQSYSSEYTLKGDTLTINGNELIRK